MGAIITGCEENSLMTMQMMSTFGEGALDGMHLLAHQGAAKQTLIFLYTTPISFSG